MSIRNEHEKEIDDKSPTVYDFNFFRDDDDDEKSMHPFQRFSKKLAEEEAKRKWRLKNIPSNNIEYINPEPTVMPDVCKGEALLELEKKYYPVLKAQRIKLDSAYDKVIQMQAAIEPTDFEIQDEIERKPYVHFRYEDNDGYGVFPEQIPDVINNLPEGFRVAKIVKASRGSGSFVYLTDKTQEELNEVARQNILKSRNKVIESAKKELSQHLKAMKELVSEYESAKKIALQADIEQLTKISQKYAKAI